MRTLLFVLSVIVTVAWLAWRHRLPASRRFGMVDAIVPAFNEQLCIVQTVENLMANPYFDRVIVVNDGSTDATAALLDLLAVKYARLVVVHQANTGKGGALMAGVARSAAPYVFLTDADTMLPHDRDGIGHLIAEIERGADAVGGLPSSNLKGAGLLPHVRASLKDPIIVTMRTFQQVFGGAPFIISGSCGLFRTEVLRQVPFSDRTKVEDLDLSWDLAARGFKARLSSRCVVYSQECNSLKAEWLRWRRWIVGYAVCMRLHRRLLVTRFGLVTILPMFLVVLLGVGIVATKLAVPVAAGNPHHAPLVLFPLVWVVVACALGAVSAVHHRRFWLIPLAPTGVLYLMGVYAVWLIHGLPALFTGREPTRDKPTRYAHVVV